jgi:hypothetical protein
LPLTGTSLASLPGTGSPTWPEREVRGLTDMKNGAVSVAPSPVSIGTRAPVSRTDNSSRLFQT